MNKLLYFHIFLIYFFIINPASAQQWITSIYDDSTYNHNESYNLTMVDKHGGDGYFVAFDVEGKRTIPFEDSIYKYTDRSIIRVNSYDANGGFEWTKTIDFYQTNGQDTGVYYIKGIKMLKIKDYYILITRMWQFGHLNYKKNSEDSIYISFTTYTDNYSQMIILDEYMNVMDKNLVPYFFRDIYLSEITQKFHFKAFKYNAQGPWHDENDNRLHYTSIGEFTNIYDIKSKGIPERFYGLKKLNGDYLIYKDTANVSTFTTYDSNFDTKLSEFTFDSKNSGSLGGLGGLWGNMTSGIFFFPNDRMGLFYEDHPDRNYVLFDSVGDTISTLFIEKLGNVNLSDYVYSETGGVILYGMVYQTFMSQCYIIEFDHYGKYLWSKQFYVHNDWPPNRLEDLKIVDDGLVLVVSLKGQSYFEIEEKKAWLIRIGRHGQTIDTKIITYSDHKSSSLIFPNPTTGIVSIHLDDRRYINSSSVPYRITDNSGRNVKAGKVSVSDLTMSVDLSSYEPGLYFITLFNTDGSFETLKVVKI